jgi:hypothetical protein
MKLKSLNKLKINRKPATEMVDDPAKTPGSMKGVGGGGTGGGSSIGGVTGSDKNKEEYKPSRMATPSEIQELKPSGRTIIKGSEGDTNYKGQRYKGYKISGEKGWAKKGTSTKQGIRSMLRTRNNMLEDIVGSEYESGFMPYKKSQLKNITEILDKLK